MRPNTAQSSDKLGFDFNTITHQPIDVSTSRKQSGFGVNEAPKTIGVNGDDMEFCCYFSMYR